MTTLPTFCPVSTNRVAATISSSAVLPVDHGAEGPGLDQADGVARRAAAEYRGIGTITRRRPSRDSSVSGGLCQRNPRSVEA